MSNLECDASGSSIKPGGELCNSTRAKHGTPEIVEQSRVKFGFNKVPMAQMVELDVIPKECLLCPVFKTSYPELVKTG